MAVRRVVQLPARSLKQRAQEVADEDVAALVGDLVDTMRASPACVGLAAPQIGVGLRVIVIDVGGHSKAGTCHGLVALVDPEIVASSGRIVGREGCMSVPHLTANVARATELVVRGRDPDRGERVIATEGFEASALQHEIDHLDGLLILDRVASLATDVFHRKTYR
jgi:peptide deformylase